MHSLLTKDKKFNRLFLRSFSASAIANPAQANGCYTKIIRYQVLRYSFQNFLFITGKDLLIAFFRG